MSAVVKWFTAAIAVVAMVVVVAWLTSPDLQFNPASFEKDPLVQRLAPPRKPPHLHSFATLKAKYALCW